MLATITSAAAIASSSRSNPTATPPTRSARLGATVGRPIGDEDVGAAGAVQGHGDTFAHRSGTDDEHPLAGQVADDLGDHLDRGVADRCGSSADAGLGAGPLAGFDRRAEQQVQRGAGGAFVLGDLPRAAHLTEDLALAEHGRIEPGGDLEQMADRGRIVLAVEVRDQLVDRQVAEFAEEVAHVGVRPVEQLGDDVDLGAVAGGQHDRFADVVAQRQAGDGLADLVGGDGDALQQRQRAAAMVDTDDQDRHDDRQP